MGVRLAVRGNAGGSEKDVGVERAVVEKGRKGTARPPCPGHLKLATIRFVGGGRESFLRDWRWGERGGGPQRVQRGRISSVGVNRGST